MIAFLMALVLADPAQPGPHAVKDRDEGSCTVFAPVTLEGRHPVILWGNGTNAPIVAYAPLLRHWASHGFVVAAAKSGQAGSGRDMLGCLDRLTQRNGEEGGFYSGRLDLSKVGASGHSQGGAGALNAGRDPRIAATAPIQPAGGMMRPEASEAQHAPMLLLSGGADRVASPERAQAPVFEGARVPVVWATLLPAAHTTPSRGGGAYIGATTAFFRWKLMGDADAAAWFEGEACVLCRSRDWTVRRK
jgi:alpha-beta hydrolase superfamily lysophospholipase